MSDSPYAGKDPSEWLGITRELSDRFPLPKEKLVQTVFDSWSDIFRSKIGQEGFEIGKDIFPQPQILGFLLHELIPLKLAKEHPEIWCRDRTGHEKDLVCLTDPQYSMEIKTSSSASGIFGNRSFAQPATAGKKSKSGYYLLVNFEKCKIDATVTPQVVLIRFAWLDHGDWQGQAAESGQAATLSVQTKTSKIVTLYPAPNKTD